MIKKAVTLVLLFVTLFNWGQQNPLLYGNGYEQKKWVDSVLDSFTLEEKIGQLFMIPAYSNKGEDHEREIINALQNYHIGGLIFMQGTPVKQAELTNIYQASADFPLLIGFDGEWGLDTRLKNSYGFPWNMTLGAIRDDHLVELVGEHIGKHCKRIGVHINFAPVVDINTNSENPIIGNRSFGEDKVNVTSKSIAYTLGIQNQGVLACAKHFPGHGDTSEDSHKTLPVVPFSKKRINKVELYPYKPLFNAGLSSVMVAHLWVPKLQGSKILPTSLSKTVVTKLLKKKLKFKGLIITDALNMKGVSNYDSPEQVNLDAFLAGNDILLFAQHIPKTVALFKQAIANRRLTTKRLDQSVRKILQAKYKVGLDKYKPVSLEDDIPKDIHTISDDVLFERIMSKAITLVKNSDDLIPFKRLDTLKLAYVPLGPQSDKESIESFLTTLKNYTDVSLIRDNSIEGYLSELKPYNAVVIAFHSSNLNPWESYHISKKDQDLISAISKNNNVVLTVFASPYSLKNAPFLDDISSIIIAYQNNRQGQCEAAQHIFGARDFQGRLPVTINSDYPVYTGVEKKSINRLGYSIAESEQVNSKKLQSIDSIADLVIKEKMAPGMQILVARGGNVIYEKNFGYHTYEKKQRVKSTDIYDVASLTKILATLPILIKMVDQDKIDIEDYIGDLLRDLKGSNKDTLKTKQVLSHYARLQSWIPFYRETLDSISGRPMRKWYSREKSDIFSVKVADSLFLNKVYIDTIENKIKEIDQIEELEYKYSDLGYYFFKRIIEKKYNKKLDYLVKNLFYKPLGAYRTSYLPLKTISRTEIVPSEDDDYYRYQRLHGNVHDMGAAMLGGVGGHAGLFSNANDVAKIMQMYLQEGYYGGKVYFSSDSFNIFNHRYYQREGVRRGLGFDKPKLNENLLSKDRTLSYYSFGHSGFTGTYAWVDPQLELIYVFLSNRTYPTMKNNKLMKENIRTKIQKIILDAIED